MRDIGHNEMRLFQHPFVAVGNGETFRSGFNAIGQKGRKGIRKLFCGEIGKHHRTANVGVVLHEFRQSGTHHCIKCAMIADIEGIKGLRINQMDEGLLQIWLYGGWAVAMPKECTDRHKLTSK